MEGESLQEMWHNNNFTLILLFLRLLEVVETEIQFPSLTEAPPPNRTTLVSGKCNWTVFWLGAKNPGWVNPMGRARYCESRKGRGDSIAEKNTLIYYSLRTKKDRQWSHRQWQGSVAGRHWHSGHRPFLFHALGRPAALSRGSYWPGNTTPNDSLSQGPLSGNSHRAMQLGTVGSAECHQALAAWVPRPRPLLATRLVLQQGLLLAGLRSPAQPLLLCAGSLLQVFQAGLLLPLLLAVPHHGLRLLQLTALLGQLPSSLDDVAIPNVGPGDWQEGLQGTLCGSGASWTVQRVPYFLRGPLFICQRRWCRPLGSGMPAALLSCSTSKQAKLPSSEKHHCKCRLKLHRTGAGLPDIVKDPLL